MIKTLLSKVNDFKVTDSHVHCKSGDISDMAIDRDVVTTGHYEEVVYSLSNTSNSNDLECPFFVL